MDGLDDFVFGVIAAGIAISVIIVIGYAAWRRYDIKRNQRLPISNPIQPPTGFETVYARTFVNHSQSHPQPDPPEEVLDNHDQTFNVNNNLSPSNVTERIHSSSQHVSPNNHEVFDYNAQVYTIDKYSSHTTIFPISNIGPSEQERGIYQSHPGFLTSSQINTAGACEKSMESFNQRKQSSRQVYVNNATFEDEGAQYNSSYQRQNSLHLRPTYNMPVSSTAPLTYI